MVECGKCGKHLWGWEEKQGVKETFQLRTAKEKTVENLEKGGKKLWGSSGFELSDQAGLSSFPFWSVEPLLGAPWELTTWLSILDSVLFPLLQIFLGH
jgi:hypothetical protein